MGPALLLIAQLYKVEDRARELSPEERLRLRQLESRLILDKLRNYLLEIQLEVLPKSPEGRAMRYALKNWAALTRAMWKMETSISTIIVPKGRFVASQLAERTGSSSAAIKVAEPQPCCEVLFVLTRT